MLGRFGTASKQYSRLASFPQEEQLEHYGNMAIAFIPPRKGERVILQTRKLALEVARVDHEFVEYGDFRIGHVVRVHGNEIPWFAT